MNFSKPKKNDGVNLNFSMSVSGENFDLELSECAQLS